MLLRGSTWSGYTSTKVKHGIDMLADHMGSQLMIGVLLQPAREGLHYE
jgi:hypothetical protein